MSLCICCYWLLHSVEEALVLKIEERLFVLCIRFF